MLAHAVGEAHDRALGNGDLFVVATDGLNEARNPDGELFGYERLLGIIDAEAQQDAATITQRLLASVEAFQNGRPRDDDQTVLVMKGRRAMKRAPARVPERIALDLPADLRYLRIVGLCVQELIGHDPSQHVLQHEIEMALHEICVNIVVHAYDGVSDGRLDVVLSKQRLRARRSDQ